MTGGEEETAQCQRQAVTVREAVQLEKEEKGWNALKLKPPHSLMGGWKNAS